MKKKISIFAILLALVITSVSYAATYHVRKDGHDTATGLNDNVNTATGALLTINHCLSAHATSPGDTCKIHAGTYNEVVTTAHSGTAGNLITIKADNDDVVRVQRVHINRHNYIKVKGLRIEYSGTWGNPGIYVGGGNCTISNNNITGSHVTKTNNNYALETHGNNNIVDSNVIDGESTIVKSFRIVFSVNGTGNAFINNTVKNIYDQERVWDAGGDDPAHMSSDNTIIRGNEVYANTWSGGGGVHPDIFQGVNHATNTANTWLIENNYFHDLNSQIGINEIPVTRASGWIFKNNIFANINQEWQLSFPNMKVFNNTFYRCGNAGGGQSCVAIANFPGQEIKNNIIIANVVSADRGGLRIPNSCTSTFDISNNYYSDTSYGARNRTVLGGANIVCSANANEVRYSDKAPLNGGDPKFVAAYDNCIKNACDFRIQKGSPLIDAGADLSASWKGATDKNGVSRPQGAAWDIGAYEYKNPDTPQPQPGLKIK